MRCCFYPPAVGRKLQTALVRAWARLGACWNDVLCAASTYGPAVPARCLYLKAYLLVGRTGVIYILSHDSIGLGEDGPTHQPVEHLQARPAWGA